VGCAASGSDNDDAGGSGVGKGAGGSAGAGQGGAGVTAVGNGGSGGAGGFADCAKFTEQAEQAPAAMLIALDMSASMNTSGKEAAADLAIVTAIDKDVFDSMALGLVTFPASLSYPPQCLCDAACLGDCGLCAMLLGGGVSCGISALPQVAMAPAGKDKSNSGVGVRAKMYDFLVKTQPLSNQDDGSPVYAALQAGYSALKAVSNVEARMLVLITDGGFSCTSVASPTRPAFKDANGCDDWEHPDNVNKLIGDHYQDASLPIHTFVVGVPGSNTNGGKDGQWDTPPYSMLLALSTYGVSGSPDNVDPACDKAAVFKQGDPAPAKPCHYDLSNSANFDAQKLADTIAKIRGAALGCVYPLPAPPAGETIDPNLVNVTVTIDGMVVTLKKRSDKNDTCESDGCWDYDDKGQVVLLGKACADVGKAATAKVDIVVGCATSLK
jgi:hypothetical protein